jgi:predicted nucleotidyltransferase
MESSDKDSITKIIEKYFIDKEEVAAVYLFGSHARGKEHPASDVDVGILFSEAALQDAPAMRDRYMVELSRLLKKDIHPVVLNSAGEGLMKQVFSHGKCIIVNDSKEHSAFRTAMFSRIADFSRYKEQMQTGLAKKVMELSNG